MSSPVQDPRHRPRVGLLLTAALGVLLVVALTTIPRGDRPLPAIARQALSVALPQWRLTQPVSEVVYGTRGFDTFGETFLLLAAVVSVIVLTRPREPRDEYVGEDVAGRREQQETDPAPHHGRSGREARSGESEEQGERRGPDTPDAEPLGTGRPERARGMTVVVRSGVRLVLPVLTVGGCYLVAWGYSPGGGFPAGAVVLGVVLLVYVAWGFRRIARVVRPKVTETVELAGAGAIIAIEALGLVLRGSVSANWLPLTPAQTIRSGGVVQAFSVMEFVEVASGLVIVVFALIGVRHDWALGDEEDSEGGESEGPATADRDRAGKAAS